jgi:hypothetical protein
MKHKSIFSAGAFALGALVFFAEFTLGLQAQQKADLIEYLKSL